jgi:hypothetical protein
MRRFLITLSVIFVFLLLLSWVAIEIGTSPLAIMNAFLLVGPILFFIVGFVVDVLIQIVFRMTAKILLITGCTR